MELEELKSNIQNLVEGTFNGRFSFEEGYDFDERYSESLAFECEIKPSEILRFINEFKQDLKLDNFFEELKQKKLEALLSYSAVFTSYTPDEALNKDLLRQRDIVPKIVGEYAYRDILNEVELNNMLRLVFIVSKDEEDVDEENITYQLDLEIVNEHFRNKISGGEAVDLASASNNSQTLARWLTSNILSI